MQSEKIGELAKALAEAQGILKPPKKGRVGKIKGTTKDGRPYEYEYRYADLSDVIEAAREALSKHGLSFAQPMIQRDGHVVVKTVLMHQSGEWIASEYPLETYAKPQEQGSALTYARRYSLTALLGIAAEDDDDGQAAQDAQPVKREVKEAKTEGKTNGTAPSDDVLAIYAAAKTVGIGTPKALAPVLMSIIGVSSAAEVPKNEVGNVIEALKSIKHEASA